MPTYQILINGNPKKIELTKTSEKTFTAKIDDKSITVEMSSDTLDLEKQFSIKIDGKTFQIEMPKIDSEKPFPIKVEEATFKAEVKTSTTKIATSTFESTPITPTKRATAQKQIVEGAVTAPMTGKIISVKVKKDDQVKAEQILCLIEAMKMENEITAPKAGTIQEVNVSEGSSVSEGEVLFVIG